VPSLIVVLFLYLRVLDEVLMHLDAEGIARVAALLRSLPRATVLLTSQADSATAHLFDTVDVVRKSGGRSGVLLGETQAGEPRDVEGEKGGEGEAWEPDEEE
jgi:energy-coupling factor transporter ATP-binding protein EcfA2